MESNLCEALKINKCHYLTLKFITIKKLKIGKKQLKTTEKTKTELIELIEEVFTKVSEPLNVVASFSNGETIYQKT